MNSDFMTVASLGRPFTLGMLYDAHEDQLIPGVTLWDEKTLKEKSVVSPHHTSDSEITASDTVESKSSLLDVQASLKASFLGGLIEVGGSAKYLNDKKRFHNQSRVTFQYKATTNFKQLRMTSLATLDQHQKDVIEKSSATHVVTAILYGTNAFFVFDSEKLDASSVVTIEGSMQALIKKIPKFDVEGRAELKLSDEEKALTKRFSCKFYGDLILDSNPVTFEEAVKTYADLPQLLLDKEENAAPVKIWLMSLKVLDSKAPDLINEISVGLVRKVQDAFEDLQQIKMRCNDCLDDEVIKGFPQVHDQLSTFKKLGSYYSAFFQQTLAKKLPSIREGKEDESALAKIFGQKNTSPFSHDNLSKWMDDKEIETTAIASCVDIMNGTKIKIVLNQRDFKRELLAAGTDHALCYVFTSVESDDPKLKELSDYLDSLKIQPNSMDVSLSKQDQWYYSPEEVAKLREKAKAFCNLARAMKNKTNTCFLVTAMTNENYKGASIYHYKNGIMVTDDIYKIHIDVEKLTDKSDVMWYMCDLTLDINTAHKVVKISEGNKKAGNTTHKHPYPDRPERFDWWPQVVCNEGLTGRCYWEVEWSAYADVAVMYRGMERKGPGNNTGIGWNALSWSFQQGKKQNMHAAMHNREYAPISVPSFPKLGVYLDWSAGTLSYYKVSSNQLSHLYTFYTKFTEPLFPCFYVGKQRHGMWDMLFLGVG
uniref:Neoverrucotoxin subunit beta-like n=1 Tax=Mastacembelus armatus TaxID=205130 RepID=A0A3Q3NIS0_9TELE